MTRYAFSVVLRDQTNATEELANRIYQAGCDNSIVCTNKGVVIVHFDQESPSFADAMRSASRQLVTAGYAIDRVEIDGLPVWSSFATDAFDFLATCDEAYANLDDT
jgi:hypothetical protein